MMLSPFYKIVRASYSRHGLIFLLLISAENLYMPPKGASLLLRRLEEVTMRTRQGCGDDYLGVLARILELDGPREALRRLDVLRLAIARYLARYTVSGRPVSTGLSLHEM